MRRIRLIICLMVAVLAPIVLLQGWANARVPLAPVSWNGFWQADLAQAFVRIEVVDEKIDFSVQDRGVTMARSAFGKEPLAVDALFVIASAKRARGETETANQIFDRAGELDKRNRSVGAVQLERTISDEDIDQAFDHLSRLATVYPELASTFAQALTTVLQDEGSVGLLREALERRPVWAEAFWTNVPRDAKSLKNFYRLRTETHVGSTARTDRYLIAALASNGLFQDAFALWDDLSDGNENSTLFLQTQDYPPIDWLYQSTGERAATPRRDGSLSLYVRKHNEGTLGRQLVRLDPGEYTFQADVTPADAATRLTVSLQCAEGENGEAAERQMSEQALWEIGGLCQAYWLTVSGSAWDSTSDLKADLSDIQFRRRE